MSSTIAYERSKELDKGGVRRAGRPSDGALHAVSPMADEIANLRAVNTQLLQELVTLREREAQAQRLADQDGLTGLCNRRRMLEFLESAIADALSKEQCVGLLFIDFATPKRVRVRSMHTTTAMERRLMTWSIHCKSTVSARTFTLSA